MSRKIANFFIFFLVYRGEIDIINIYVVTKKALKRALIVVRFVLLVYHVSVRTREVENRLFATCLKEGLFVILHNANSKSSACASGQKIKARDPMWVSLNIEDNEVSKLSTE